MRKSPEEIADRLLYAFIAAPSASAQNLRAGIVEAIRVERAQPLTPPDGEVGELVAKLRAYPSIYYEKAAAEIERLTAELAHERTMFRDKSEQYVAERRENDRLRLANIDGHSGPKGGEEGEK